MAGTPSIKIRNRLAPQSFAVEILQRSQITERLLEEINGGPCAASRADLMATTHWSDVSDKGHIPASLYVPECWLKHGVNTLTVFDEEGANPEQVGLVVERATSHEVIRADEAVNPRAPVTIP